MSISFIGTTVAITAAAPATYDETGYDALSWSVVGKVISDSGIGETAEDISFVRLADARTIHINGALDIVFDITLEYDESDAGQVILEAARNTNTVHSLRIIDSDGDEYFYTGLVANYTMNARSASQYKGATFTFRAQSGETKV